MTPSFVFGQNPISFDQPKPRFEAKTGFGWFPFGNSTTQPAASSSSSSTTVTITAGVGVSNAPNGGANGTVITINVGNVVTINPSVGSTVNISPGSGTSIVLNQSDGGATTITLASNPTSGATSTPGIGGATSTEVRPGFSFPNFPSSGFPTFPTPTFGQSSSTSSISKVCALPSFGTHSSPFGAQPIPEVGGDLSRHSASVSHQGRGSRVVPYTASNESDTYPSFKFASISAMPIHKNKSHEELRWEDYQSGDKGVAVPRGGCPFGCGFSQTSSRNFNSLTSTQFAERCTNVFAKPSPIAQTSSTPCGAQPSPGSSGVQSSSSLFDAKLFSSLCRSSSDLSPPSSSVSFSPPRSSIPFGFAPSSSPSRVTFGDSSTSLPSSFEQTSSPNFSFTLPSQVPQPDQTNSTSSFPPSTAI